jgi:hypothetical protein
LEIDVTAERLAEIFGDRSSLTIYCVEGIIDGFGVSCYPKGIFSYEKYTTLHFDNATVHNLKYVKETMIISGFTRMEHPSYRQDLAPCDFVFLSFCLAIPKSS